MKTETKYYISLIKGFILTGLLIFTLSNLASFAVPLGCGDGKCTDAENYNSCPTDCNGVCEPPESCGCSVFPEDCYVSSDCCSPIVCGDGTCHSSKENCQNCESDCGKCPKCGDGVCSPPNPQCSPGVEGVECPPGETCSSCAEDCCPPPDSCTFCGDGTCNGDENCEKCGKDCCPSKCPDGRCSADETKETCPEDCAGTCQEHSCGDGTVDPGEECDDGNTISGDGCSSTCTNEEDHCGNGTCDEDKGEDCTSCEQDCGECHKCGDGTCNGTDTCENCPGDCGACESKCGNGIIETGEQCDPPNETTCNSDCQEIIPPKCGDDICNGTEDCSICPNDCGACCGNGICNKEKDENCKTCSVDCGACEPYCGDGTCNKDKGETCTSCTGDCGACPPPPVCSCDNQVCPAGERRYCDKSNNRLLCCPSWSPEKEEGYFCTCHDPSGEGCIDTTCEPCPPAPCPKQQDQFVDEPIAQ